MAKRNIFCLNVETVTITADKYTFDIASEFFYVCSTITLRINRAHRCQYDGNGKLDSRDLSHCNTPRAYFGSLRINAF